MMWEGTIRTQINTLNQIADWASMTSLREVRDHCRLAIAELKHELDRCERTTKVSDRIGIESTRGF